MLIDPYTRVFYESLLRLGVKETKRIGGDLVLHRRTCPVCNRKLVNIYRRGQEWRRLKCWKEDEPC